MPFCFCPLRSGSSGNVLYASPDSETHILMDAGLSARAVECLLREIEVSAESLTAILITHEHTDHIAGVGLLSQKYGIPVYATAGTFEAMSGKKSVKPVPAELRRIVEAGAPFFIGNTQVFPFSLPHDAAEPVGYVLENGGTKLAVATDLGHISPKWMRVVEGADLLLLEANHNKQLLMYNSRYPAQLRMRIAGSHGHLSNQECGEALVRLYESGIRHVILGHLSAQTNTPELALQEVSEVLQQNGLIPGEDIRLDMAYREKTGGLYVLGEEENL